MHESHTFGLVAAYDRMRLETYRTYGRRGAQISIETLEESLLLRFNDVSYFNMVYGYEDNLINQLETVEHFFKGSQNACKLLTPTLSSTSRLAEALKARGWVKNTAYAWLSTDRLLKLPLPEGPFVIRPPRINEQELFFHIYLQCFGADHNRIPAAVDNMRHLFLNPNLHFLFACRQGQPVGVGMLYHEGHSALLSAGAMLPAHRGCGGQLALLAARIELAIELGCTSIHSWVSPGGHSHQNLEKAGLKTVGTSLVLQLPASRQG